MSKLLRFILAICLYASCVFGPTAVAADTLPFKVPTKLSALPESALIETSKGYIEIEFYRKEAPITVRNFEYLARKGFFNNLSFHRVVSGFVIQGGDPRGDGKGGPGYTLPAEFSDIPHVRGTIGQSRLASEVNPKRVSNGSQFYICLRRSPHLDGLYTVFARIINGMEVADRISEDDKIVSIHFPVAGRR